MRQTKRAPQTPRQDGKGRLAGRRIVITGAASGIGRCTAEVFAAEGAIVGLIDRDAASVADIAARIVGVAAPADVTDDAAVARAVDDLATSLDGIDGVVTAAGIMWRGAASEVPVPDFRHVVGVNLIGTYAVIHHALPWLKREAAATIVTIGSAQGLLPNVANRTAYAASKGGVVNLTRALAAELAPSIRANCVCPGLVETPMADGVRVNVGNYALGRLADPREIANAILFLTSADSSYVTGATLAADGGRSFH